MAALIGALRVSLSADTANFETGMRRAQNTAASGASSINKSLSVIKGGLQGFAAAFTVGALTKVIGDALEYAGSLGEVSQQLGVTTKDLQTFRFIAGQVGVSQEQLETGLSKLTITMGKVAAGAKAPTDALRAIGISADQLKGKNTGEAFRIIADGLQKVTDRSQRAAVEVALFGKSGAMLDTMLSGGSGQINELSAAAEKLGIVLSDTEIQHADETADKLAAVKTVLQAQIAGVVAKNADSILSLASSLGTLSGEIVRFLSSNPQAALGIVGALLGGRVGGLPGAVLGGAAGAILGGRMADKATDSNMDLRFRKQALIKANNELNARKAAQADKGSLISLRHGSGKGGTVDDAFKEWQRQMGLLQTAVAAAKRPKPPAATDIPQFLGPKPKKPPTAAKPKADHSAEDALRDEHQFDDELRSAQMDTLQARRDLAHSSTEQASLDVQMLDLRKQDNDSELDYQVQLNKLTDGKEGLTEEQAKQLRIAYDQSDALKREAIAENLAAEKAHDRVELQDHAYGLQIEQLQLQDDLATTAKERRDAELRILDVMKRQEKARLEAVIADTQSSDLAKQEAQQRLDHLDNIYAGKAQGVMNQTRNPLEEWAQGVPKSADEITEAYQKIAANGLDAITDSIMGVISGTQSLKEAFTRLGQSIAAEILQMTIKMMIFRALSSALGLAAPGAPSLGSAGGSFISDSGFSFSGVQGFATGGSFTIGGVRGVDKNTLALNGIPIANVSHGERIDIANDNPDGGMGGPPVNIVTNIDATGADPAELGRVRAAVQQLNAELPYRVVQAWYDARSRNVIR